MSSTQTQALTDSSGSEDQDHSDPSGIEMAEEKCQQPDISKPKITGREELPGPSGAIGAAPVATKDQAGCSKDIPGEHGSPSHCQSYKLPEIETPLSPLITEEHYRECYRRIYKSHYGLRLKQVRDARERLIRETGHPEGYYERLENKDEISIRGWIKYALPREAAYLLSLVQKQIQGEEPEPVPMEPPSPEDDRTYSLSEGLISKESVESWKTGLALALKLMKLKQRFESIAAEIKAELDPEGILQRDYFTEDLSVTIISLRTEIANCYGLKSPYTFRRCSTSTSYDLDDDDSSQGIPLLHSDSAATDVDSEVNQDTLSDISDCLKSNSFSAGTQSGSGTPSDSSELPSPQLES